MINRVSDRVWKILWWFTMTIAKIHIYLILAIILAIIVVIYGYKYLKGDEVWVSFETHNIEGKILVPEIITKSKDCQKFFEWQSSTLPPLFHGVCPWYKYTPDYEVSVGSIKFKIPRKCLFRSTDVKRYTGLLTTNSFIYPSFELEGGKYSPDGFHFNLRDNKFKNGVKKSQDQVVTYYFWKSLRYDQKKDKYNAVLVEKSESKYLKKYRLDISSHYRDTDEILKPFVHTQFVYTNDDINNPKDYVVCSGESNKSTCKSIFAYKDIYIDYMFKHHLIDKADDIKSGIIKLVKEWELNAH